MANVMVPQKKPGVLGTALTIGGGVAGGIATGGSPGGIAAGAGLGGTANGMLSGGPGPGGVQSNAVQRRIDTMQPAQNDASTLAAAENALASMPEPYQKQYGPALRQARIKSEGVA